MEPTFCEMYAKFCEQLASGLPESYEDNEKVVFKWVLLNKCQEEFERDEREQTKSKKAEEHDEEKILAEERWDYVASSKSFQHQCVNSFMGGSTFVEIVNTLF